MQTIEQPNERAADLYWLAFLITGDREPSLDLAIEVLDFEDDANPRFSTWISSWSRRVVIAKALCMIRGELAASARRPASGRRAHEPPLSLRNWVLDQDTTKLQLERALLAIEVFPRCALLLSVFEGISIEDVAILLDSDGAMVRKGQMNALRELTGNLARMQVWTSDVPRGNVLKSEMQHA